MFHLDFYLLHSTRLIIRYADKEREREREKVDNPKPLISNEEQIK